MKRWIATLVTLLAVVIAVVHNVPTDLTPEDETALRAMIGDLRPPTSYVEEISDIRKVQDAILDIAPVQLKIPLNARREPSDLLRLHHGFCYDRSRSIEKALRLLGFETRHIALYSTEGRSALSVLTSANADSHSITEVRTSRGWLVVDSNDRWISLTRDGRPVPIESIPDFLSEWDSINRIYTKRFTYVYGLYSRHGRFYPPMNPIPDVNWREFMQNITSRASGP